MRISSQDFKFSEDDSLQPHLASTFNVSIPFKETLMGLSSNSPSHAAASTIYYRGENKGFMFNAEKAKKTIFETPKILKPPKLDLDPQKAKKKNKNLNSDRKNKNKIILSARDRGKFPTSTKFTFA